MSMKTRVDPPKSAKAVAAAGGAGGLENEAKSDKEAGLLKMFEQLAGKVTENVAMQLAKHSGEMSDKLAAHMTSQKANQNNPNSSAGGSAFQNAKAAIGQQQVPKGGTEEKEEELVLSKSQKKKLKKNKGKQATQNDILANLAENFALVDDEEDDEEDEQEGLFAGFGGFGGGKGFGGFDGGKQEAAREQSGMIAQLVAALNEQTSGRAGNPYGSRAVNQLPSFAPRILERIFELEKTVKAFVEHHVWKSPKVKNEARALAVAIDYLLAEGVNPEVSKGLDHLCKRLAAIERADRTDDWSIVDAIMTVQQVGLLPEEFMAHIYQNYMRSQKMSKLSKGKKE